MRLKSLKLAGFKSFANPTTFTFRHGITAIVGPNGCGKSNVIDAIRWVLGESSAKQLRGGAMSDVIFAGTDSKSAKSVASVELTIEHTQDEATGIRHELNLYQELSIRRQVNRDGKSDYFINGTRCRRRDVIDVFLGTGLGSRSYAVIEQGMIGRIVDSSPLQLREFIEEAAGVSRYQARREETQKKLVTTADNLARLDDMRSELARQQKTLARQAASAQAYQGLKDELNDVQQKLAIAQLTEAKLQELKHKAEQQQVNKQVEASTATINTLKEKLAKLESRMAEAQWLKDDAQDRYHQHELARQQANHQLNTLQEKLTQSDRRIHGLQGQLERSDAELAELAQQYSEQNARLEALAPTIAALESKLAEQQASQAPLEAAWQTLQQQINDVQSQRRQQEQQQALQAQAQQQLNAQLEKWQRQNNKWQQHFAELSGVNSVNNESVVANAKPIISLDEQLKQIRATLTSLSRQHEDLEERLASAQPKLDELAQGLQQKQKAQQTLEKRHATLSGEYDSLHRMLHPPKQPVKQIAATNNPAKSENSLSKSDSLKQLATLPKLSEQIELSPAGKAHAEVLDYWLTLWLDSALVEPPFIKEATPEIVATLAALYSQPYDAAQQASVATNSLLFAADSSSSATAPLVDVANAAPLSQLISKPKLAIWQQCYLLTGAITTTSAQDESSMLRETLAQLPKGALLLTPSGWLVSHAGTLHLSKLTGKGNAANNAQFLAQRLQQQERLAELEESLSEVEDRLDSLNRETKTLQAQHDELAVTVQELNAQAKALTHSEHSEQQRLTTLQAQHERQQAEQVRLQAEREALDSEQQELKQTQAELEAQAAAIAEQLTRLQPQFSELQSERDRLASEREQHQQTLQVDRETLQNLRFESKEATLAANHASTQRTKLAGQQEHLRNSLQAAERQLERDQVKLPELQAAQKSADSVGHEQQIALEEYKASLATLRSQHTDEHQQLETLQNMLQQQQATLAEHMTQVAIYAERIKEASERLLATGSAVSPSTILTELIAYGSHSSRTSKQADNQAELQKRETELARRLSTMGAVNLAAAAELVEVESRLLPLEQQIGDITASMDTLTDAIATIDTKTKALFNQTLEAVNRDLASLFAKVFGGGQAMLSLQDDDSLAKADKWRAGIELMAQPKGKKNSRLAVLSGGEKTLTALSLIFAIFKQHPAPFCVLDEVDAPLDDANVKRFTGLIHELADDVQFIFISHNKLAMQIADELKGITMPQAGVSTLVSVSLEEAEQYIDV
ncbi:AAA family ATPase [Psychrobacter arenosus]|uniref:AAA family ATPase n=1 Tax=Psychrobacter arenosus TaxID=256326 RepID=UPI001918F14D|nr:AAA family ATPase [Psychrobacter arenosus]